MADVDLDLSELITDAPDAKEEENSKSTKTHEAPVQTSYLQLNELPAQIDDFASMWYHHLYDAGTSYRIHEYNAYLEVLKELETGELEIPEIDGMTVDGKQLATDIKLKIIKQFRQNGVDINIEGNIYHKAFFAHCAKRYMDSLKSGNFIGSDGFVGQKPEIANIIISRVEEVFAEKTLGVS